ncbi:MAG: ABC transporter permease [Candidatus Caldarchaeum sp.]|nr:ABC transporter permease [Candidatus Caldarchaeum sp.]
MKKQRKTGLFLLLLLPPLLFYAVFFIFPFLTVVGVGFGAILPSEAQRSRGEFFTLDYFQQALDPLFLRVLSKSLLFALATTAACIVLGFPVAYMIAFKGGRYKNFLVLLVILPLWVTFLLRAYAVLSLLGPEGVVNAILLSMGVIQEPLYLIYNEFAVMLGMIYGYLPFMILPLYASLEKISKTYIEAARSLGAGSFTAFLRITLPLSKPGLVAGSLLTFIPAAGEFVIPSFLGGPGEVFVGTMIYSAFISARNWNWGSALSLVYIAMVMVGVAIYLKYSREEFTI